LGFIRSGIWPAGIFRENLGFCQVGARASGRLLWRALGADLLTILSGGPVAAGLEGGFVTPGAGLLKPRPA
jgi:hypothetical protein